MMACIPLMVLVSHLVLLTQSGITWSTKSFTKIVSQTTNFESRLNRKKVITQSETDSFGYNELFYSKHNPIPDVMDQPKLTSIIEKAVLFKSDQYITSQHWIDTSIQSGELLWIGLEFHQNRMQYRSIKATVSLPEHGEWKQDCKKKRKTFHKKTSCGNQYFVPYALDPHIAAIRTKLENAVNAQSSFQSFYRMHEDGKILKEIEKEQAKFLPDSPSPVHGHEENGKDHREPKLIPNTIVKELQKILPDSRVHDDAITGVDIEKMTSGFEVIVGIVVIGIVWVMYKDEAIALCELCKKLVTAIFVLNVLYVVLVIFWNRSELKTKACNKKEFCNEFDLAFDHVSATHPEIRKSIRMRMKSFTVRRLLSRSQQVHHQIAISLYPCNILNQRNFSSAESQSQSQPPSTPLIRNSVTVSLRSRDSDEEKRRQEEQQRPQSADSMVHRRNEEEYNRREAIMSELKALKEFIENHGDDPLSIINRIKQEVYGYDSNKTTAAHRCESMRRIVWLSTKYLSVDQWFDLAICPELESVFGEICDFMADGVEWLSVEEMSDILWTLATLGLRPQHLISKLVAKVDRILLHHKRQHFGYEVRKEDTEQDVADKTRSFGYVRGSLQLPFKHNEFADILYSFGCLRIESGNLISLLDAMVMEHYPEKQYDQFTAPNRLLDGFLPRDLSNLCIGYAMMDPAFHWYKIVWGLNRHLNILSNYIQWTFEEKLNILHYDVCMRYINVGWKLQLNGEMAKVIDENFIKNLPRLNAPYHDPLNQEIYDILCEQVLSDQYFCKNIEGFQIPFSRWEPRDEPAVIEPLNKLQFARLDPLNEDRMLLGRARLRRNVLKVMLGDNYRAIPHFEWPQTKHLQHLLIRKKVKELDAPLTIKQNLLQHTLEPHYKPLQKGLYD